MGWCEGTGKSAQSSGGCKGTGKSPILTGQRPPALPITKGHTRRAPAVPRDAPSPRPSRRVAPRGELMLSRAFQQTGAGMANSRLWKAAAMAVLALAAFGSSAGDATAQAPTEFNYQRAIQNYQAVQSGAKRLDQLTPQERAEVSAVARATAPPRPPKNTSECRRAWESASSAASDVSDYAQRLKRCVESGDFSDDCSTEYRRVKNAHSEYEDAVSQVGYSCR